MSSTKLKALQASLHSGRIENFGTGNVETNTLAVALTADGSHFLTFVSGR